MSRRPFDTLQFLAGPNEHVEPVNGKMYLRGGQFSNAAGSLRFHTILPGWYEPRIPHIHLKVTLAERTAVTTQLYFPESLTTAIYREHPPYAPYGLSPYHQGNDVVMGDNPDARGLLLQPQRSGVGLVARARNVIT